MTLVLHLRHSAGVELAEMAIDLHMDPRVLVRAMVLYVLHNQEGFMDWLRHQHGPSLMKP